MNFKTLSSKEVYNGKVFKINHDLVELPNGENTTRDTVKHKGATAIIPVDENGNIYFVRQYRHAFKEEILEIPAGIKEGDELPETCALRELEEEIGMRASKITYLFDIRTAVGFSNEVINLFLAENLIKSEQNLDDDEFIEIEKYSLDKAIEMIENGEIKDSKTMIALLYLKTRREKNGKN